jgi:hypothetical protein
MSVPIVKHEPSDPASALKKIEVIFFRTGAGGETPPADRELGRKNKALHESELKREK